MQIEIGFSTSNSWISRLIEWGSSAKVSHAFFILKDENFNDTLIYQSDSDGPEIVTLEEFLKDRKIVCSITPSVDISEAVKESIKRYIGFKYDYAADLCDAVRDLGSKLGMKWDVDFHGKHAFECAALVVQTLRLVTTPGYPDIMTLNPNIIQPGDLLAWLGGPPVK